MAEREYKMLDKYTAPVKRAERPILGREQEMRRVKAALMRPELCNVMLLAPAGSGKALVDGTMIPVADERGYVPIQDLKPGDYVFDERGDPVRVIGVYPQGFKPVFEVTFGDGSKIRCCDEHLWSVRSYYNHKTRRGYQVHSLGEMMRRGIRAKDGNRNWWTPVAGAVKRAAAALPVDPYVVGMFLGSGSVRDSALHLASDDVSVVRRVGKLLGCRHVVPNCHGYGWNFVRADGDRTRTYVQTKELADKLGLDNTVFGVNSKLRSVPEIYFNGSVEQRTELLRGLMDSNGYVGRDDRSAVRFSTRSRRLADDVMVLARSLGLRVSLITKYRTDKNNEIDYEVHFKIADADKPRVFRSKSKKSVVRKYRRTDKVQRRRFDDLKIDGVEDLHTQAPMTCIYVDSETHLFQAGRCHVVTHNTALVQGTMLSDPGRKYLEVDLSRMISDAKDANEFAAMLKILFDETADAVKNTKREIVLFIDEFHQIVQLSAAAVEALKPLLADSGTRGIRVIAATTYIEFRQYISPNQPLVERLQRINLAEPDKKTVMAILKNMASRYGSEDEIPDDTLLDQIYEYTNRYIPSNAQPRKSLLIMDAMLGWHRAESRPLDMSLLADVIYESEGVNVAFRVDASKIKEALDKRVLSQQFATAMIEERLQICVADLNNKKRPMSSFLFSGSSGVGKSEVAKTLAEVLFQDRTSLITFDMTEYANPESLERFRREMTARVWAKPFCILLLDEIEKACAQVTRLLLQVLDDGRLMDENNRIVSFLNCYIIMTTNAGSEVYKTIAQYNADDTGSGRGMSQYNKLIRESITKTTGDNRFPPELLGRINVIVPFQPLSEKTMKDIAFMNMQRMRADVYKKHGVKLAFHKNVVRYLVEDNLDTDSDSGGARTVIAKLESELTIPIARYINQHPEHKQLRVDVEGTLVRDDPTLRVSDAYIVVKPIESAANE